jgi:PilY1 beta-propeller domain
MNCKLNKRLIIILTIMMGLVFSMTTPVLALTSGTVNIRVSDGNDDAEEDVSDGDMDRGSSDLEMIHESEDQIVGIRFRNITIPQGSTITNAYIQFTTDEVSDGATDLTFVAEDVDNAVAFSDDDDDISDRDNTSASVDWDSVPEWGSEGDSGYSQQTPDLTALVQEVVNRGGWVSGNAMVFIITGSGTRIAESYNGSSSKAPLLHIEYTSDVVEVSVSGGSDDAEEEDDGVMYLDSTDLELVNDGGRGDQTVGIRFQSIAVPPGAVITSAYIVFETDETTSEVTNLTIKGEAISDAPVFSSTPYDISNRTTTSQSVIWNIPSWDTYGQKHPTPDLSAVVQEIVGTAGWASGNDMAFIISGTGQRVASAYEDDQTPPLLHIEYSEDPVPIITVDKNSIGGSCYQGASPSDTDFTLINTGSVTLDYTVADDATWLSLSPSTGSGSLSAGSSVEYAINFSTSGLAVGTHEATITLASADAPNSPVEIPVSVTVLTAPEATTCGNVPLYAQNLVSPAILILLDISSSMTSMMNVSAAENNPQTPDLTTIVQEIVDRAGWVSGNAMAFKIEGSGHRTAVSYNGNSGSAPLLHVAYNDGSDHEIDIRVSQGTDDAEETVGGSGVYLDSSDLEMVDDGGDQVIGIRFQNVTIPQGASISDAYIEFTIDETGSDTTNLTFYGEDSDNPWTYADLDDDISGRTYTTASVSWSDVAEWAGVTQEQRIEIGRDVISDLVKDRSISWGYGTWCNRSPWNTISDYTIVHIGTKAHTEDHQTALQAAISATTSQSGTPFSPSIQAAQNYFDGNKADAIGDAYVDADCQPKFLIDITDGQGNTGSSVSITETNTTNLANSGVTPIGVGFGLEYSAAGQLYKMAEVANEEGEESETDDVYALHEEDGSGVGQPFFAFNKEELIEALSTITESVKGAVFHGSAPAPTTSVDLGDTVIVAKFDAASWTGDVDAVSKDGTTGLWTNVVWTASDELPELSSRSLWTVDDSDTKIEYNGTNFPTHLNTFSCLVEKPIGDIINSTPVVVGAPPFFYPFDNYANFAIQMIHTTPRDTMIYIGANDGMLHAFNLADGVEEWAFVPNSLHAKLAEADTDPLYDRCDAEYCHQYYVDGSPQVADIYADFSGSGAEWRTMLVVGQREGGMNYLALDVTSGQSFSDSNADPAKFLWEFGDTELGQTWADPAIESIAVKDSTDRSWGIFFGSGYVDQPDQSTKEAYMYGLTAHDAGDLWRDFEDNTTNRIPLGNHYLAYVSPTVEFPIGAVVTGGSSGATATVVSNFTSNDILELENVTGTFQDSEWITGNPSGFAVVSGTLTGGGASPNNALAAPMLADLEGDYIADRIYVGDLYGKMYRIRDIGQNMTPDVTTLFDFNQADPNKTPIRAKASYAFTETANEIMVYFGTGIYESQADKQNDFQQYFFGLRDGATLADTYELGDLVTLQAKFVTVDVDGEDKTIRYVSGTNDTNASWKMQLYEGTFSDGPASTGTERVIAEPLVVAGIVFFTTFIPDENVCAGAGETWVFALDYESGLTKTEPIFDLNKDGQFNDDDLVEIDGEMIVPIGIKVGRGKGSYPVLHKDIMFITTTGDGDDGGGSGNDEEGFFAQQINLPERRARLESWRNE